MATRGFWHLNINKYRFGALPETTTVLNYCHVNKASFDYHLIFTTGTMMLQEAIPRGQWYPFP